MRMYDILEAKKNKRALTEAEIRYFVKGYTDGSIPDYQASALLMAICLNGMDVHETAVLTDCMARSGDMLDMSHVNGITADKHSTGGVGDKTSLIVAPVCAACGLKIAKMSGRGLGHTGGTVDKLESITGYNTALSKGAFFEQVNRIGLAIIGQTGHLAPADQMLYALRDVTATVDSIPLIAASIMSKKLAAGDKNIVLDVKYGSGAFMKTPQQAEKLAQVMVEIGKNNGRNTAAVITDMNEPLGYSVGNALEVIEAVEILKNRGDARLRMLCLVLAANMLSLSLGKPYKMCFAQAENSLQSGAAFHKLQELVAAQGGDTFLLDKPARFPQAECIYPVYAAEDGFIACMDTQRIGETAVLLGAGREKKEDAIDMSAGLVLCKKTGDAVQAGETLAYLHAKSEAQAQAAQLMFLSALHISPTKPEQVQLIYKTIR